MTTTKVRILFILNETSSDSIRNKDIYKDTIILEINWHIVVPIAVGSSLVARRQKDYFKIRLLVVDSAKTKGFASTARP